MNGTRLQAAASGHRINPPERALSGDQTRRRSGHHGAVWRPGGGASAAAFPSRPPGRQSRRISDHAGTGGRRSGRHCGAMSFGGSPMPRAASGARKRRRRGDDRSASASQAGARATPGNRRDHLLASTSRQVLCGHARTTIQRTGVSDVNRSSYRSTILPGARCGIRRRHRVTAQSAFRQVGRSSARLQGPGARGLRSEHRGRRLRAAGPREPDQQGRGRFCCSRLPYGPRGDPASAGADPSHRGTSIRHIEGREVELTAARRRASGPVARRSPAAFQEAGRRGIARRPLPPTRRRVPRAAVTN